MTKFTMTFIAVLLTATLSQASVKNSNLELRHLNLIEKSINENCSIYGDFEQISVQEEKIRVDQGITDTYFTVILEGTKKVDQQFYDRYTITVKTALYDQYDHNNQEWGAYDVMNIKCEQN